MSAKVNNLNTLNMKNPIFYSIFKPRFLIIISSMLFLLRGSAQNQTIEPYDILISEFMPDPTPKIGLPESEYIELYNRTAKTINLNGFKFINGTASSTDLPNIDLKPKSFVIVYAKKSTINFGAFGDTIQLTKLPTLSNPGDIFYLKSPQNIIIDAASYDLSFYQNSKKADGGWSLERININAPCLTNNWIASNDLKGGTPGQKNSIYQDFMDKTPSQVLSSYTLDSNSIVLNFDKSLHRTTAIQIAQYKIDNNLTISSIKILDSLFNNSLQINLNRNLKFKTLYNLIIKTSLTDCQGIPLSKEDTIKIQLPEKAVRNDLIINELLMNSEVGGSRFVEIYNRSEKVIDIYDLKIANLYDTTKMDVKSIISHYSLFPKSYVALTESPLYIQNRYKATMYKKGIVKNRLPTWGDAFGNATIYGFEGTKTLIIDAFNYNKSFHNPLLTNTEGVSLERINPNDSTNSAANWHSAAATVSYATPAYQNSQVNVTPSVLGNNQEIFTLINKTFSPNDDSFQDYLLLHYAVDKKGYFANISIFDMEGKLVKTLIINELLSTEGQFKWDGETDEKLVAPVGTYIIYIEMIDPDGGIKKIKKLCVLADKF